MLRAPDTHSLERRLGYDVINAIKSVSPVATASLGASMRSDAGEVIARTNNEWRTEHFRDVT